MKTNKLNKKIEDKVDEQFKELNDELFEWVTISSKGKTIIGRCGSCTGCCGTGKWIEKEMKISNKLSVFDNTCYKEILMLGDEQVGYFDNYRSGFTFYNKYSTEEKFKLYKEIKEEIEKGTEKRKEKLKELKSKLD